MSNHSSFMHSTLGLFLVSVISFAIGGGVAYYAYSSSNQQACEPGCFPLNIFGSPGCYDLNAARKGILKPCK